jgi:hypothetical protein
MDKNYGYLFISWIVELWSLLGQCHAYLFSFFGEKEQEWILVFQIPTALIYVNKYYISYRFYIIEQWIQILFDTVAFMEFCY